jgi:exosome complex RNA-binding protein Rrp4
VNLWDLSAHGDAFFSRDKYDFINAGDVVEIEVSRMRPDGPEEEAPGRAVVGDFGDGEVMTCMRSLLARLIGHTIASETATSAWRGCETMVYKRGRVTLHDREYRPYRNHEAHIENL